MLSHQSHVQLSSRMDPDGTWFFTVNLLQRHNHDLLVREVGLLRGTVLGVLDSR